MSMPVCAVGFDDTVRDNNKISTEIIVEHNLDDGTITEKTYVINKNLTDTTEFIADASPFFLDPVDQVDIYPSCAIGLLRIKFEGGIETEATGFLVADDLVLTAAHCVQQYTNGYGNATSIYFYPGYDAVGSYPASSKAHAYYVSIGWGESMNSEYDWALLKLSIPVGSKVGIIPCRVESSMTGKNVMVIGYPEWDHIDVGNGRIQGVSEGKVVEDNGVLMRTQAEGRLGTSGGPILDIENWNFTAVGVVSGKNIFNHVSGPKITTTVVNLIKNHL